MTYRVTALGCVLSALAGGATLPPQHKLFSPKVETSLRGLQITASLPRNNFVVPAAYAKSKAFTLANMSTASGILECTHKAADSLRVEESATHLMLSFFCQGATLSAWRQTTGVTGDHSLILAYEKSTVPMLFKYETGLKGRIVRFAETPASNRPTLPAPSTTLSKDEEEMKGCVDAFQAYQTQSATTYLRVTFVKRVYHCETYRSRDLYLAHRQILRSSTQASLKAVAGTSRTPFLYVQNRTIIPDQHPPEVTTFDPSAYIAYNSKPDPLAANTGIRIKIPTGPTVLKLSFGENLIPDWSGVSVQVSTSRTDKLPAMVDGKLEDLCSGAMAPPGLLTQFGAVPIFRDNTPPVNGSPVYRFAQIGSFDVPKATLEKLAQKTGRADEQFYIRMVPVDEGGGCTAAPSNWVAVHLHDNYPAEKAEADALVAERAAIAPYQADDGRGGAPVNVTIRQFVPYNLIDDNMQQMPGSVLGTTVSSNVLSGFGIDHPGGDWNPGCAYSPSEVLAWGKTDHANLDSGLETVWDDITVASNLWTVAWNGMFRAAGEMLVYVFSAGKCPFDDPYSLNPPANGETEACLASKVYVTKILVAVVNSLSGGYSEDFSSGAGGLTALINAADKVGKQAAEQEIGELFDSEITPMLESLSSNEYYQLAAALVGSELKDLAKQGVDELADAMAKKATAAVECSDPDNSAALWAHATLETNLLKLQYSPAGPGTQAAKNALLVQFDQTAKQDDAFASALKKYPAGTYSFDSRYCVVQAGSNPATWGNPNPARIDSTGGIILSVRKNLSSPTPVKASQLPENKSITITVTDRNGWYKDAYVRLSVSKIPAEGLNVPVMLTPNLDKFANQARLNPGINPAIYDVDIEQSLWLHAIQDPSTKADFEIQGTYEWTAAKLTWYPNILPVIWDRKPLPILSLYGPPLPSSPPPCTYCNKGDGSARTCNQ